MCERALQADNVADGSSVDEPLAGSRALHRFAKLSDADTLCDIHWSERACPKQCHSGLQFL